MAEAVLGLNVFLAREPAHRPAQEGVVGMDDVGVRGFDYGTGAYCHGWLDEVPGPDCGDAMDMDAFHDFRVRF
jgi:hypothetical protein